MFQNVVMTHSLNGAFYSEMQKQIRNVCPSTGISTKCGATLKSERMFIAIIKVIVNSNIFGSCAPFRAVYLRKLEN